MNGVTGRSFNVSGTGLNQYIMLLAPTGTGKEAINRGISKITTILNAASNGSDPVSKYIGPSEIRSDAGLLKCLAKSPCFVSVVGEFGLRLKRMKNDRGGIPHEVALKGVLLDLYSKSGAGEMLGAMAYSDAEKSQAAVHSPAFSLIGESTPERFFEALDEGMVYEGLLPRFTIIDYDGPRPPRNDAHTTAEPSPALVEGFVRLLTQVELQRAQGRVVNVEFTPEAKQICDAFDEFCDGLIDAPDARELQKHMWSRAYLKAMKLAATVAVGIDFECPVIDADCANWAIGITETDCRRIIGKFEKGQVGDAGGNEERQQNEVRRVVSEFLNLPWDRVSQYGGKVEMHQIGIFTHQYLQRRLLSHNAFKGPSDGTPALKRAITNLIDAGEIEQIPTNFIWDKFGIKPKSYQLASQNSKSDIATNKTYVLPPPPR